MKKILSVHVFSIGILLLLILLNTCILITCNDFHSGRPCSDICLICNERVLKNVSELIKVPIKLLTLLPTHLLRVGLGGYVLGVKKK